MFALRHQRDTGRDQTGRTGPERDTGNREPQQKDLAMYRAPEQVEPQIATASVDHDIRDFLAGKTDGGDLLHALYDHVLDEPVPERLRALLGR